MFHGKTQPSMVKGAKEYPVLLLKDHQLQH